MASTRSGSLFPVPMDPYKGVLGLDFETASAVTPQAVGSWAYSCHPSTVVYLGCYTYAETRDDRFAVRGWHPAEPLPREVEEFLQAGGRVLAHNAGFEQAIIANILEPVFGWPTIETDQWCDSAAVGCAYNLPRTLEGLGKALGCDVQKDKEGRALMLRMAVAEELPPGPDGRRRWHYPLATTANLRRLGEYCAIDIRAMMDAWFRLAPLSIMENRVWRLDQQINRRGVLLDQEFAAKLRRLAKRRSAKLADATFAATCGELANSTSSPALKAWLKENGVELPMMTRKRKDGTFTKTETAGRNAVDGILKDPTTGELVRSVLENRLEANKATSLSKLNRIDSMVGADGRLRSALTFCGASTGRWSSSGLQLHNLPKDKLSPEASKLARYFVERECLEGIELVENRPLEVLSQMLRSVLVAAPGYDFIAADFSGIEARVCAWLAGQHDKLQFLHEYDAGMAAYRAGERATKPMDLYEYAAEGIGSDQRQLGKVAELALQFGMGDIKFAATAAGYGVRLALLESRRVKKAWRETNPCIVQLWATLEDAVRAAIEKPGTSFPVGEFLRVHTNKFCLFLTLPSGRALRYWRPQIVQKKKVVQFVDDEGAIVSKELESATIQFRAVSKDKRGMEPEDTYGGKLVENVTQAVARELLAEALLRLDAAGYPFVVHVHDSAAAEVPAGTGDVAEFCRIMSTLPRWAAGLPVATDGYRDSRFRG